MLSYIIKYILTASSVAPVCFTLAALALVEKKNMYVTVYLSFGLLIGLACWFIIDYAKNNNETIAKNLRSVSPANKEITNYFLTYLFPLVAGPDMFFNWKMAMIFFVSLFVYIKFSENYCISTLIAFMGYKFYKAEDNTG